MMTKAKTLQTAGLAALCLLPLGGARATSSTYVMQGPGGDLIPNAFATTGIGDLTEIDGVFPPTTATGTAGRPDLFAIDLTAAATFSATTVGTPGTVFDTQLYLFSASGDGIYYNDDDPSQVVGAGATLPADFLPAGLYYLGVSPEGAAPQSAGGNIFPNPLTDGVSLTGVYGPTGIGGAQPLSKWNITSDDVENGSYTVLLTGAAFALPPAVPEAPAFALLGLGLLPLALAARRRVSRRHASQGNASSERTSA